MDLFTGLASACVPAFCDGLDVDLATAGGSSVSVSYRPAALSGDGVDACRAEDGGRRLGAKDGFRPAAGVPARPLSSAGRIVIAVHSEPDAGEAPVSGTITCTWSDPERPSGMDAVVAGLLAGQVVATVRIGNLATSLAAQRARAANLEEALATNREIGQAIGILMAIDRLTATGAFGLLRTASQHSHRSLRDVAAEVIETGGLAESPRFTRDRARLRLAPAARSHLRADPSTAREEQGAVQRPGLAGSAHWPPSFPTQ